VPQSSGAPPILRLGSRGSPLALTQARMVRDALCAAHGFAPERIAIEVIRTTGDRVQGPLADAGGKGLFTKEIEEALAGGAIDLAVHSSKDMPAALPAGLVLAAFLEREDPRDAFVSRKARSLDELPQNSTVGTSSPRRQALLLRRRPDLRVVPLRGNVETRLRRLDEGVADATLLALAGLKRLGRERDATAVLSVDEFLPAIGQGAIGIEIRAADDKTRALLAPIDHAATAAALAAERATLAALEGTCRTPIAGHATVDGGTLRLRALIVKPDGSEALETQRTGAVADAAKLGADAGLELKRRAGPDYFAV
jgi:hydroxymethylbilane synthase